MFSTTLVMKFNVTPRLCDDIDEVPVLVDLVIMEHEALLIIEYV